VFVFLDRVLDQDLWFVGTESRLRLVIETLSDLVVGSIAGLSTRSLQLPRMPVGSGRFLEAVTEAIIEADARNRVGKYVIRTFQTGPKLYQ